MTDIMLKDSIEKMIFVVRGQKVMLDRDLGKLYGVNTKELNRAVKRQISRFPDDFMYQLTREDVVNLRFQFGTSSWGGRRYLPNVFTEQGVAMLSSVLNSERAVRVNIAIMRTFVRIREILLSHKDLAVKIEVLESKYKNCEMKLSEYDGHIRSIFEAIRQLMAPPTAPPRKRIGFHGE